MKKFKKIFIVLASLLTISTSAVAGVRNNMPSVTIASAEESTNERSVLLNEGDTSQEETTLGEIRLPTEAQMKIMVESGEYYNIHYLLISSYLLRDRNTLRKFVNITHPNFKNVVIFGMRNSGYGQKNPDYDIKEIGDLITAAVEKGRRPLYQYMSVYGGLSQIAFNNTLKAIYAFLYLPTFILVTNQVIKEMKESEDCPELIRNFEPYEIEFSYTEEAKTPAEVPYYWIIVAGVGGIAVTTLVFVLINLKKKKRA